MESYNLISQKMMSKVLELVGPRRVLFLTVHGSHLYGLNNENSDVDIKGVFMPLNSDILLEQTKSSVRFSSGGENSKNSKDDYDIELFSINEFFRLASNGDTGAISMLSAPEDLCYCGSKAWDLIVKNKNIFYSKNMAGLIGFVRTQTDKYCKKGERLKSANDALSFLESINNKTRRLKYIWDLLPEDDNIYKYEKNGNIYWSVCERSIQNTSQVQYCENVVKSIISSYGKRSIKAFDNNGADWKAISHAFRVANELSDLYKFGNIKYPMRNAEYIKDIKLGKIDFKSEVLPKLNALADEVNYLSEKSDFEQEVNIKKINDFLYNIIKKLMRENSVREG